MDQNPYQSSDLQTVVAEPKRSSKILPWLALACTILLLVGLLIPSRRCAREAARHSACQNNLKQITLALLNYEADHGSLPPAFTVDVAGRPLHSWRTLLLPYLEQKALYASIDLAKPWNDPTNEKARLTNVPAYSCPSTVLDRGYTTYVANSSSNGPFPPRGTGTKSSDIKSGPHNSLFVLDVDAQHSVPWMSPDDIDPAVYISQIDPRKHQHRLGLMIGRGDGSVECVEFDRLPEIISSIVNFDGSSVDIEMKMK